MRYTRDEMLTIALDMVDSPTLNKRDRPGGTIEQNALCIKWLQKMLDHYHSLYPFSGDVTNVPVTVLANTQDVVLQSDTTKFFPPNYITDVRNGLILTLGGSPKRLRRTSFQTWLDVTTNTTILTVPFPNIYTKVTKRIRVAPKPSTVQTGDLWYYALPIEVQANAFADYPDEWGLIEYVKLMGFEWSRKIDPGTADRYMRMEIGKLRQAGLLDEAESEQIPIGQTPYVDQVGSNRNAWMGNFAF